MPNKSRIYRNIMMLMLRAVDDNACCCCPPCCCCCCPYCCCCYPAAAPVVAAAATATMMNSIFLKFDINTFGLLSSESHYAGFEKWRSTFIVFLLLVSSGECGGGGTKFTSQWKVTEFTSPWDAFSPNSDTSVIMTFVSFYSLNPSPRPGFMKV